MIPRCYKCGGLKQYGGTEYARCNCSRSKGRSGARDSNIAKCAELMELGLSAEETASRLGLSVTYVFGLRKIARERKSQADAHERTPDSPAADDPPRKAAGRFSIPDGVGDE